MVNAVGGLDIVNEYGLPRFMTHRYDTIQGQTEMVEAMVEASTMRASGSSAGAIAASRSSLSPWKERDCSADVSPLQTVDAVTLARESSPMPVYLGCWLCDGAAYGGNSRIHTHKHVKIFLFV